VAIKIKFNIPVIGLNVEFLIFADEEKARELKQ